MQPTAQARLQQHGFMACWCAAACTVCYCYRRGPRPGLPAVWAAVQGLPLIAIDRLAAAAGLKSIRRPQVAHTDTAVTTLLKRHGPVWAAGDFVDGYPEAGHAIVLTGVKGPLIVYNDPWEPKPKHRSWQSINAILLNLPNALLVKDTAHF